MPLLFTTLRYMATWLHCLSATRLHWIDRPIKVQGTLLISKGEALDVSAGVVHQLSILNNAQFISSAPGSGAIITSGVDPLLTERCIPSMAMVSGTNRRTAVGAKPASRNLNGQSFSPCARASTNMFGDRVLQGADN
jgi:hypothetical protein